jgi:uncharacterized membrane protein
MLLLIILCVYIATVILAYLLFKKWWMMDGDKWSIGAKRLALTVSFLGPISCIVSLVIIWVDNIFSEEPYN